ncbi:unnamed protein product [Rotaria socialis]|uniref:Amine oxidase domain-containing protein n=1 Tax=Rotaria socialis TaxID=392032 RepID=A0A817VFZ3_9BILA|nr:unnamed protein product [Rotaria socialis]CAF3346338.1 unnamed protein product [Rotaria socialis]CAF3354853.1 unnamed protein product [Rotaria socialis]CAF3401118.1 unnamed protein product [Rotaria socialis]CAF4465055.1 unnamed protein product [Rotaria socialis]
MENTAYDVAIIGCGSSGIAAGIELLSQSNLNFIILEARDRVGGRAYTDQHSLDFPFDLGAEWIHEYDFNNSLYSFHEQFQTDLNDDYYIQLFDPTRILCYDSDGSVIPQEVSSLAQITTNRLFTQFKSNDTNKDTSVYDAIQPEYNRLEEDQHKRLVKTMIVAVEEIFAADLHQLSAKQYLNNPNWSIEVESENNLVVKHGLGYFLERITNHFQLPILFNTVVTEIDTLSHADMVQILTSQNQKISAKYVIITVPLGCLKQNTIIFQPPLPQWKLDAIDQLGFGHTDKIIMQFDKTFWNEKATILYLVDASFPFALCNPAKCILSFMIGGRRAQKMEDEKNEITIAQIMKHLKQTFSQQEFKLKHYIISRWTQDEFARGSYSYFAMNSSIETMGLLAKECSENRLFWAGEHTSDGASVHTAFATGTREAKKILNYHSMKT